MKLIANLVKNSSDYVPSLQAGRSPLCVDLYVKNRDFQLPESSQLVISALELFTNTSRDLQEEIADLPEDEDEPVRILIPAEILPMGPGCWHIIFDIVHNGKSLVGANVGAELIYQRDRDEPLLYTRASFNLARVEIAYDRESEAYKKSYPAKFPPTGDPFNKEHLTEHAENFDFGKSAAIQEHCRGGKGFLQAACVYAAFNHNNRLMYCEEVIQRLVGKIENYIDKLTDSEKNEKKEIEILSDRSQSLIFLSQVYFYYDGEPGEDRKYAQKVLDIAKPLFQEQLQLFETDQKREEDKDILKPGLINSLAWYCLAHKAEHGQFYNPETGSKIISESTKLARQLLKQNSQKSQASLKVKSGAEWERNLSIFQMLSATLRMTKQKKSKNEKTEKTIKDAILTQIERLFNDYSGMRIYPSDIPKSLAGDLYEIFNGQIGQFDERGVLKKWNEIMVQTMLNKSITNFSDLNACGAMLQHCAEYQKSEYKPPFPWSARA